MRIGFIGAGKLGLPCALAFASRGHDAVVYDVSPHAKNILATRVYPHRELLAQELLQHTTLRAVDTVAEVVEHVDLVLVAVQTPHQPEYEGTTRMPETRADFDYSALKSAVAAVAQEAERQRKYVVVDVISTCLPGTCEREVYPLLNSYTGFTYSPYFIAMGTTIPDALRPEFALLGFDRGAPGSQPAALEMVQEFYRSIHSSPHCVMSVASAELTKVAYNVFLGQKITSANAIMEVAHKVGADVDDVMDALALATDRVASAKYMRGGMGDGGGCFVKGEKVRVERGWVPIEEIVAGDRALGGDGKYHEVVETYRRPYKGPVLTIENDGLAFTVTPEHPVCLDKRDVAIPARYVQPGDRVFWPDSESVLVLRVTTGLYEGTVYNLNVADVHNYVCEGGLVQNCHPRDQIALSWLADELDLSFDVFGALVRAREAQTEWLAELAVAEARAAGVPVAVLGKAYKRGTNLVVGSPATLLKNILAEYQFQVEARQWDPHVDGALSPDDPLLRKPHAYVVATDHDEFFQLALPRGSVVVDPWGKFADQDGVKVVRVGRR